MQPTTEEIQRMGVTDVYKYQDVYYQVQDITSDQIFADLTIIVSTGNDHSEILVVGNADIMRALDTLAQDEVYTTEGLCDVGCTDLSIQNYIANMAINENYFYPISTVNSTNYMTIANGISKLSQAS